MHILNICQLIYSLNTFLRTVWLPVSDTVVFRSCWNLSGGMASICTESTGVGRSASDNRDSCKLCKQNPICTGPCSWGILLGRQESWKTRCFNRILSSHQPKWARAVRDEEGEEAKADVGEEGEVLWAPDQSCSGQSLRRFTLGMLDPECLGLLKNKQTH